MVETNRSGSSRRRRRRASEFFHCFSLRSSTSSMKISSKSILSPGRNREQPTISLSSSLSRRLRSNGSMKGGGQASPMFPTGGGSKKKGSSFETAEPSSPKVTCIGQVRVKSKKKKHGRQLRNRSLRKGEVSFRKNEQAQDVIHHSQQQSSQQECLPHRNQRWVHLPMSICETLRCFGSEFNCFGPCGGRRSSSSCLWTSEKRRGSGRSSPATTSSNSCGSVFARWLFAMQESEEKGKEIASVCREREKREVITEIEMEISEEKFERKEEIEEEEEEIEEGRESICVPPKNALLLMRSRSAPFRMSSLANRFWESPATQHNGSQETREEEEEELETEENVHGAKQVLAEEEKNEDNEVKLELEEETKEVEMLEKENPLKEEKIKDTQLKEAEEELQQKEDIWVNGSSPESLKEEKEEEEKLEEMKEFEEKKEERRVSFSSSTTIYLEPEPQEEEDEAVLEEEAAVLEESDEKSTQEEMNGQEEERESSSETETSSLLPECLLLMMCEPKLSMEVSKETWVCSTDFIRYRQPEKKVIKQISSDESMKKQNVKQLQKQNKQKQNKQFQAARSSFSKVEPAVIEQKLVKAGAYEPLVLKRCKSEPNRTSAKLAPEACFWKKNMLDQPEIGC